MKWNEIDGNLITLAKEGKFDVIAHGCNCFCKMGRGLAPQMAKAFGCDRFSMEDTRFEGDINKLGNIEYEFRKSPLGTINKIPFDSTGFKLFVVNAYTQYHWDTATKPLNYAALTLCMLKINHIFKGKHIGLPEIGCHLAGGNWELVSKVIKEIVKDCDVTIVHYKP
jgi:O-acetyl-ADP-ribose deacetylase (regulator of RNase III)